MSWANYLFPGLDDKKKRRIGRLEVVPDDKILERISQTVGFYTTESNEDTFQADTTFESFHHQARTPISDRALLAGFLMLWLKRCVVPTTPHEAISIEVVYPAVMLAYGRPLGLLPAMVGCLQSGLRVLTTSFCNTTATDEVDEDGTAIRKVASPRVELPYTYLVAWFVLHCPTLMTSPHPVSDEGFIPFVQRLENSSWNAGYMGAIRKIVQSSMNYQIYRCFPEMDSQYGDQHADIAGPDGFTKLDSSIFWWLINIRPGYLVFR
jgi:hypothetical protein